MTEICPKCGLNKELCVCETIAKEEQRIKIKSVKRRFGKIMTVVEGMDEKDIKEVVFVEVKSGKSKLSSQEKNLKEAIDNKRVKWVEYRIPEELTKKGNIEDRISDIVEDKMEEAEEEIKKEIKK